MMHDEMVQNVAIYYNFCRFMQMNKGGIYKWRMVCEKRWNGDVCKKMSLSLPEPFRYSCESRILRLVGIATPYAAMRR